MYVCICILTAFNILLIIGLFIMNNLFINSLGYIGYYFSG